MNKKLFVESINAIEKQHKHDEKCAKKLSEVFPHAYETTLHYDHHWVSNALLEVLVEAMQDNIGWIKYFLFDLDFGKKNRSKALTAKDANGNNIPLENAGQLWEFLNKEKNA